MEEVNLRCFSVVQKGVPRIRKRILIPLMLPIVHSCTFAEAFKDLASPRESSTRRPLSAAGRHNELRGCCRSSAVGKAKVLCFQISANGMSASETKSRNKHQKMHSIRNIQLPDVGSRGSPRGWMRVTRAMSRRRKISLLMTMTAFANGQPSCEESKRTVPGKVENAWATETFHRYY